MLRSSKVHHKSSDLFSILKDHFGKDMNLARIKHLQHIGALMGLTVLYSQLCIQNHQEDHPEA